MIETAQQKANESAIVELENIICAIVSGRVDVIKTEILNIPTLMTFAPLSDGFKPRHVPKTEQQYTITVREVR